MALSEHGSQAPHRRWYLALGPGRVGRRWIHGPLEQQLEGPFFVYAPGQDITAGGLFVFGDRLRYCHLAVQKSAAVVAAL